MKNEIILYDYEASPCARRVKICLMEKGIPYKTQTIDLSKMEQKNPDYLRINPNGLVPAINHNGRVIFESSVIIAYLEDNFPKVKLTPKTSEGVIAAKQWESYELAMANTYRPLMYASTMGPLQHIACTRDEFLSISAKATDNPAHLAWQGKVWDLKVLNETQKQQHRKTLVQFIDLVERSLENKKYLVDNAFTLADISVYPRITMLPLVGVDINHYAYPNVCAWIERVGKRRSIRTTYSSTEKSMVKLNDIGLTSLINRIVYKKSPATILDKLVVKVLRPILRKKLGIDEALLAPRNSNIRLITPDISDVFVTAKSQSVGIPEFLKNEPLMFYGYTGSPVSDRIVLVCKLLGVEYTHIEIDMAAMEHKKKPFQELNPAGELPLLLHGDTVINDSLFMAEYLSANNSSLLFSSDSYEQAEIRMWHAFDMGMRKEYRPLFFSAINKTPVVDDDKQRCLDVCSEKISHLENALTDKDYLVGNRFTYADIVLYTRLSTFSLLDIDSCFKDCPSIHQWLSNVEDKLSLVTSSSDFKKNDGDKRKSKAAIKTKKADKKEKSQTVSGEI